MSAPTVLTVDRIVTAAGPSVSRWLLLEDGFVSAVGSGSPPSAACHHLRGTIVPGFLDSHVHGALGLDFVGASREEAQRIAAHQWESGSTDVIASLASAPLDQLEHQVNVLGDLVRDGVLMGLHLEGPYLSPKRSGAHDRALLRRPDLSEVQRLIAAGAGAIRVVTIAPELPGAEQVIRWLTANGVRVAVGHTSCDAATARASLEWGATIFTHLFNGMPPIRGRAPGPAAVALSDTRARLELIVDGCHLDAATVGLSLAVASQRTMLVSDAMAGTGFGDGKYAIGGSTVYVQSGVARTESGSLAGSIQTLGAAMPRLGQYGLSLAEIVQVTSATAAMALGLPPRTLQPGSPASLVQMLPQAGDTRALRLAGVMRNGLWLTPPG